MVISSPPTISGPPGDGLIITISGLRQRIAAIHSIATGSRDSHKSQRGLAVFMVVLLGGLPNGSPIDDYSLFLPLFSVGVFARVGLSTSAAASSLNSSTSQLRRVSAICGMTKSGTETNFLSVFTLVSMAADFSAVVWFTTHPATSRPDLSRNASVSMV